MTKLQTALKEKAVLERALEMACKKICCCPFTGQMNISCEDCEARQEGEDCETVMPKLFILKAKAEKGGR